MSEPERLRDLLPPVLAELMCLAEHPVTGCLCRRIACPGEHNADGVDPWTDPTTTPNDRRTA